MNEWSVLSMESQPDTGVVVSVNWQCSAEQDGVTVSTSGTAVLPPPEGDYIPYEDLTQQQVLYWVWVDGGVDKDIVETSVNNSLTSQLNPQVIVQPLPWQG